MEQTTCKFCGQTVLSNYYFCPYCGKKLIEPPLTMAKEIGVYLISFFLPPLGLLPGIKYLFQKSERAKKVGIIAIILTVVSIIITIWITVGLMGTITQSLSTQTSQFSGLGM
jgi:hypothetical protein